MNLIVRSVEKHLYCFAKYASWASEGARAAWLIVSRVAFRKAVVYPDSFKHWKAFRIGLFDITISDKLLYHTPAEPCPITGILIRVGGHALILEESGRIGRIYRQADF
jgi:hypothetical protein